MPVVEVNLVGDRDVQAGMAERLADALADALDARPEGTWVKVVVTPAGLYAEGAGGPEPGVQPVFVTIIRAHVPRGEQLRAQALRVADAVSVVCSRPLENVHVIYEAEARGRIAFGGRLVD